MQSSLKRKKKKELNRTDRARILWWLCFAILLTCFLSFLNTWSLRKSKQKVSLLFTDLLKNNTSVHVLSAVGMHASPLQEAEWIQAHPSENFILMLGFCLTWFYCQFMLWFKKWANTEGNSSFTVAGKNEVTLGNASWTLVSHLGWEKLPWNMHGNSCHLGNLFITVVNQQPVFQYHSLKCITVD